MLNSPKPPQFAKAKLSPLPAQTSSCCNNDTCTATPETEAVPDTGARYSWLVDGMDCAACARKVENAVKQIASVQRVQVLFATQKLLVTAESDIRAQVEKAVKAAGYNLRTSTSPAPQTSPLRENLPLILLIAMMALSWGLEHFNHPFGQFAFIATTLVGLWPIARQAVRLMRSGNWFAIETLMSVAAIGALFIGATAEALSLIHISEPTRPY